MKLTKKVRYKLAEFLETKLEESETYNPSSQYLLYLLGEFTAQYYRDKANTIKEENPFL